VETGTILIDIEKLLVVDQPMEEISAEGREKLKRSIEEVGLLYPLLVAKRDKDGNEKYEVLDGRTRLGVLRELGYHEVRCVMVDSPFQIDVIPYDAELYRRHLDKTQMKRYEKIREAKKEEFIKTLKERAIKAVDPRIKNEVEGLLESLELNNSNLKIMEDLAGLQCILKKAFVSLMPEHDEKAYAGDNESAKIEGLTVENQRLREEIQGLEEKIKLIRKQTDPALLKKEIAEKLKEIDGKYRQMTLEDKKKLLEEERRKIEKEYEQAIADANRNVEQMAKSLKETRQRLDSNMAEIERLDRLRKEAEKVSNKYQNDLRFYKHILGKATGVDRLIKRLEDIKNEIQVINQLLVERGYTGDEFDKESQSKMKETIDGIGNALSEMDEILKQIA